MLAGIFQFVHQTPTTPGEARTRKNMPYWRKKNCVRCHLEPWKILNLADTSWGKKVNDVYKFEPSFHLSSPDLNHDVGMYV